MNTSVSQVNARTESMNPSDEGYNQPHYDIQADDRAIELSVFLPGVSGEGLEILLCRDQLIITARRNRIVRPNWEMLRLECAQQDYRLNVKLGFSACPESVRAEVNDGILKVRVERIQNLTTYRPMSVA